MDFNHSTHRARWILTSDALAQRHRDAQRKALEGSRDASPNEEEGPEPKRARDSPISPEEEALFKLYFERKIPQICRSFKFPARVQATAVVYFKRFYTVHSCLEFDPARIMPVCIYLAAKIEESYISAEELCKHLGMDSAVVVLKNEVPLLQALAFDLMVFSPYRALRGMLLELSTLRQQGVQHGLDESLAAASPESIAKLEARAGRAVDAIMHSDAPLLFPPAQLAAAALRSAARQCDLQCRAFLAHAAARGARESAAAAGVPPSTGEDAEQRLVAALTEVDRCVAASLDAAERAESAAADIDRRIKLWKKQATAG